MQQQPTQSNFPDPKTGGFVAFFYHKRGGLIGNVTNPPPSPPPDLESQHLDYKQLSTIALISHAPFFHFFLQSDANSKPTRSRRSRLDSVEFDQPYSSSERTPTTDHRNNSDRESICEHTYCFYLSIFYCLRVLPIDLTIINRIFLLSLWYSLIPS